MAGAIGAIGGFLGSKAGSAVVGLGTSLLGSKKNKKLNQFVPPNIASTGFGLDVTREGLNFSRSSGLQANIDELRRLGLARSSAFADLRSRVQPGVGDLTRAKVRAIRDAGSRTVGNLREELSQRRVLGSSFAQREIASTEALFGREEERARAEGALTELGLEAEFLKEEFQSSMSTVSQIIEQFNFESQVAGNLAVGAGNQLTSASIAAAQAESARQAGIGEAIGRFIDSGVIQDFGKFLKDRFG